MQRQKLIVDAKIMQTHHSLPPRMPRSTDRAKSADTSDGPNTFAMQPTAVAIPLTAPSALRSGEEKLMSTMIRLPVMPTKGDPAQHQIDGDGHDPSPGFAVANGVKLVFAVAAASRPIPTGVVAWAGRSKR